MAMDLCLLTLPQLYKLPILILGKEPISLAIASTLKLFYPNIHQSPQIPNPLNQPDLILSITTPNTAIAQIHHLRTTHKWEGTFIAILPTPQDHHHLQNLNIFGEPNHNFAYRDIPGHTSLISTSPHLLTDLLCLCQQASHLRIRTRAWQGLLAKSSLHPLLQQLHPSAPHNSQLIPQILRTIHSLQIDWDSIITHENARYIRQLKIQYPPGISPPATDHPQILSHLQQKLAHLTGHNS